MRLNGRILLFAFFILIFSCSRRTADFRTATIWIHVGTQDSFSQYALRIPGKCNCQFSEQEGLLEKAYLYSDSSYIFLATRVPFGAIPQEAVKKYGSGIYLRFTKTDEPISANGIDTTGKYFDIERRGLVVYGYKHVSAAKKGIYDSALISIARLKTIFSERNPQHLRGKYVLGDYEGKCK